VIHEQPAITGSVAFGANLPQPRQQWTELSQSLQSLHILITDLALRPSSHGGLDNAPQVKNLRPLGDGARAAPSSSCVMFHGCFVLGGARLQPAAVPRKTVEAV
jgi:hypothetical protein